VAPEHPHPPESTSDDALRAAARRLRAHHDHSAHHDHEGGGSAGPGSRIWHVAESIWLWVPLTPDWEAQQAGFDWMPERRGFRLRLFCDEYGLSRDERAGILGVVEERIQAAVEEARTEDQREWALRSSWHVAELRDAWERYLV